MAQTSAERRLEMHKIQCPKYIPMGYKAARAVPFPAAHAVYSQRLLFAAGALCGQGAVLKIRLFEFVNLISTGGLA